MRPSRHPLPLREYENLQEDGKRIVMPKIKTRKGAAKRFEVTKTGKIVRHRPGHSHILTKKSPKRKRRLRSEALVSPGDRPRVKRFLGI